jgi:hypothetical protein
MNELSKANIVGIKSRRAVDEHIDYVGFDPIRFKELMKFLFCGEAPCNDKASWVMVNVLEKYPDLMLPYRDKMLDYLEHPGTQIMFKRHIIKAYYLSHLPKKKLGLLTSQAMQYLANPQEGKALRVYSMNVLEKIVAKYPELKPEFELILKETLKEKVAWLNIKAGRILAAD